MNRFLGGRRSIFHENGEKRGASEVALKRWKMERSASISPLRFIFSIHPSTAASSNYQLHHNDTKSTSTVIAPRRTVHLSKIIPRIPNHFSHEKRILRGHRHVRAGVPTSSEIHPIEVPKDNTHPFAFPDVISEQYPPAVDAVDKVWGTQIIVLGVLG